MTAPLMSIDFCSLFQKEEDCIQALFQAKWPQGFCCPRCGHAQYYFISTRRLPLFECRHCRTQTSLIAGTIMERSRTPLRKWFQAIYLHSTPQGVNALQLSSILEVTYKTAWLICHKIRHAMAHTNSGELLTGLVRVMNATYSLQCSDGTPWHKQEQPLLIGISQDENDQPTRIKMTKEDKSLLRHHFAPPNPESFIRRHVDPTANVIVHRCYQSGLNQGGQSRFPIEKRHGLLFHIGQQVEWWLARVFRGIGPKHLQAYLDHYCYVWNRQKQPLFDDLLRACSTTKAITYPELTRNNGQSTGEAMPVAA